MPVRRELHALGRSCADLHRADLSPSACRNGCCVRYWACCCRGPDCSASRWRRPSDPADWRGLIPGQSMLAQRLRAMLALAPDQRAGRQPDREAAGVSGGGTAEGPRGIADRVRAAGADAAHQRGNDTAVDPVGRRGRGAPRAPDAAARSTITWASTIGPWPWRGPISRHGRAKPDLDAIVINASGCGTTVKDYGFMFRSEPEPWREARREDRRADGGHHRIPVAFRLCADTGDAGLTVAYHSACSLQHGQQVTPSRRHC